MVTTPTHMLTTAYIQVCQAIIIIIILIIIIRRLEDLHPMILALCQRQQIMPTQWWKQVTNQAPMDNNGQTIVSTSELRLAGYSRTHPASNSDSLATWNGVSCTSTNDFDNRNRKTQFQKQTFRVGCSGRGARLCLSEGLCWNTSKLTFSNPQKQINQHGVTVRVARASSFVSSHKSIWSGTAATL